MPQVSKRYLPEEKLEKIYKLFFDLITNVEDVDEAKEVITEILTKTEQVIIAKRIACFYLIYKKVSSIEISEAIKLSISTVTHYQYIFENSKIIKEFLKRKLTQEKITNILKDVFVELWYGMPRKGSDWKYNKKQYYKHKRELREPI